ncbi:MAG: hypothetical protein IKH54_00750 [Bacilli bacterium]|nr:hypothetical protein [Bacilli bacterium]
MAITMSGAKVDSSNRDSLRTTSVDTGVLGNGVQANKDTSVMSFFNGNYGAETGHNLAGVTAEFATKFSTAVDTYVKNVQSKLDKLESVDSGGAFKGSNVATSLETFINSVKSVANSYLSSLQAAENQIAESVVQAYSTQDTDISGNLNRDSSTLEGSAPKA